jgi:proline iminopeptidase
MDRLADAFRLIYYDQRGRGKSARNVRPDDVSLASEIDDLDHMRESLRLDVVALLGHSWGGLLAMEYAIRLPDRVSHLVLMNSIAASHDDRLLFRKAYLQRLADKWEQMQALAATLEYAQGDPDIVAAYYRIHYSIALAHRAHLDPLVDRLRASFTAENILQGRAIEDRLWSETLGLSDYTLLPQLTELHIPALILHGEDDFVPVACAAHIAEAIPGARMVVLQDCGHFSYMEVPDKVHKEITGFFAGT